MSLIIEKISKVCSKCHQEKSLDCFGFAANTKDKKKSWCRECNKLNMQAIRQANPELQKRKNKEFYQNNIIRERKRSKTWRAEHNDTVVNYFESPKGRFAAAKASAKNRKLPWTISFDDYVQLISQSCFYCNDKLNSRGIGLDRLDSLKGYCLENVVPCCAECNYMKQESTVEDFKKQIVKIAKNLRLL